MLDVRPRKRSGQKPLKGTYTVLEPVDWDANYLPFASTIVGGKNTSLWDYMSIGPFKTGESCLKEFGNVSRNNGWQIMMIRNLETNEIQGTASFMRIRETYGSAEIGFVLFNPSLQKTRCATEAIYLMIRHLFEDLNYRRVEWKCDNNNTPSKRAAKRFGFSYEGLFRQDLIVKGQNRDTAWFSIIDSEWSSLKQSFESWLSPDNFDFEGRQRKSLNTA
jgi:RimJ/RimL family protein N-acetyltransferase